MKQPRVHPGYGNTKRNEALKGRHEFPPSSLGGVLNQKTSENMSQSLAQIYIHLIFSTKKRQRSFQEDVLNEQLRAYLGGILREIGCPSMAIGTPEDHVHILFCLSRTHAIADVVGQIKSSSSGWMQKQPGDYCNFAWQGGYGAFSVSASGVEDVRAYISNQVEHHKKVSFLDEFRLFLEKYNVPYDERYVWD